MVQLRKIVHRENYQIGIYFGFDDELQNKAKSLGAVWSQTHKCWYLLYNKENYNLIKRTFDSIEIIQDKNNERHSEPAGIQQEIVHIAETIGEIRHKIQAEHKGAAPEIASKIVYRGSTGKYWVLKVPYQKTITPKQKKARINTVLAD